MSARDELMLDSMGPSATGGFELKTHAGGPETANTLLFIADSMRSMLDAYEAPNYLELEVKASDGKRYIMTLQRAGNITPHAARVAAEEALEAAKPRTITTPEELDALPNGATLKSMIGGEPVGRVWGKVEGEWWGLALHGPDRPVLPAALIHLGYPEPEDGTL